MRKTLAEYDLTLFQLEILLAVELNEGATLFDIFGRGHLDESVGVSVTAKAIQRLAEGVSGAVGRNLILKEVSSHNAKARTLRLSSEGKTLVTTIKKELGIK
ncbi:hypothetical protein H0A36_28095 [Endozoicomonas sp. SM1973]|uniref:HTH marR-type domain-containing protein n=2 Tax=Spartinivicinus marinus TaxID=2994442 RepID=A0A853IAC6_9GAMM|nr:hypothetical protein [Spartinivicinus marinus]